MKYTSFEELPIWQKARKLSKNVFQISSIKPFCNDFSFKDQIRRSSASIMDNIAEGFERGGNKEFIYFLYIAKGSCGELRSQSYRAFDFNYIDEERLKELVASSIELSKEISGFTIYLKKSGLKGEKFKKIEN